MEKIEKINQLIENDRDNLLGYLLQKDPNKKSELELFITIETNKIWQQKITKFDCDDGVSNILLPKLGSCCHEISQKLKEISQKNFIVLQIMNDQIYLDYKTGEAEIEYLKFNMRMLKLISTFSYKELFKLCLLNSTDNN